MSISLHEQIAQRLNVHPDEAEVALSGLIQYILLKATVGESVTVEALGTFIMGDHKLLFTPDLALSELINHRYSGHESRAVIPKMEIVLPEQDSTLPPPSLQEPGPRVASDEPPATLEMPVEGVEKDTDPVFVGKKEDEGDVDDPLPGRSDVDPEDEAFGEPAPADALDHPLGPLSEEPIEEADFSVVDPDGAHAQDDSPFLKVGTQGPDLPAEAGIAAEAFDILQYPPPPPDESTLPASLDDEPSPADPAEPPHEEAPPRLERPGSPSGQHITAQQKGSRSRIGWGIIIVLALILGSTAGYFLLNSGTDPNSPAVVTNQPPVISPSTPADTPLTAAAGTAAPDSTSTIVPEEIIPPEDPTPTALDPTPAPASTGLNGGIDRAEGGYALIVGSAISSEQAAAFLQNFAAFEMPTDVLTSTDAQGVTRYRIGLGQFPTADLADSLRKEMADQLPEGTWILRITADM